ncbi:MAG: hypothetical protein M0T74_00815 [Desulfitobacterium hafniense]|nr:hypothetical protein [Desulfitobacterium hafniense]
MWPRRMMELLIQPSDQGVHGVRAFLEALNIRSIFSKDCSERDNEEEIPTEQLFWPGINEEELTQALRQGVSQREIGEFLHNYLSTEVVVPVPETSALINDLPLLLDVLNEAGFDPSYIWCSPSGHWVAKRNCGIHWVVPENWLLEQVGRAEIGRNSNLKFPQVKFVLTQISIQYYEVNSSKYIGSLARDTNEAVEKSICDTVKCALELGIPWKIITKSIAKVAGREFGSNLRCSFNDFEQFARPGGEKLSAEDIEYLEDRRTG